jgi:ATP-dependent DNA helicase RecG
LTPQTSIQFLKGVGEKRAALYGKLGVHTIGELLRHFPRDYIDLSKPCTVREAPAGGEACVIRAVLASKSGEQRIRKGLSIFKLAAEDEDGGRLTVTIFNAKYTVDSLAAGEEYLFCGKAEGFPPRLEMASPMIFPVKSTREILPVYPQTAGIHSGLIRRNISQALESAGSLPDLLPEALRLEFGVGELNACMQSIHFPHSLEAAAFARERFIFEELLILCCALSSLHSGREKRTALPMEAVGLEPFYRSLPFAPTGAQLRCIGEAAADLCSGTPMNRLIQGDVGSGKTLVAAGAVYFAVKNGYQCAMMAPTEILAEQHLATMRAMLEPLGIRVALLTGSTKAAEKRIILQSLADGLIDLCVGTHALISEGVRYGRLGLVVTDEQHRFGVAQRASLSQKAETCHVLVMSATPIPRTLSLMIYGDLQLSVLDELPPGRQPVETLVVGGSKRERALGFVRNALEEGRQAYIVCPLIEMGEIDTGLRPATEYAGRLAERELQGYSVGLLHGKMKPREKEETMRRFKAGELQALVSTTVVEVGVDVPNATIILIENAERFGLSQLHQLRGRVGRGQHKSWCILVSDARGETARKRLSAMKNISDGFRLAELDLQLRGPGDFFGQRQHGLPELKVASLADNMAVMQRAQDCAAGLLRGDPGLSLPEHAGLREAVGRLLGAVGGRPN